MAKVFCLLWLLSLFFPIRYVFPTAFSYKTGLYSDFTTISLYLSDIFLFITWILILPRGKDFYHVVKLLFSLFLWGILVSVVNFDQNWPLSLFFLLKIIEIIVAYGTVIVLFKETSIKIVFLSFFSALSTAQALLALNQFILQHPVGLFKLGEQQIFPWMWGIAKIVSSGTTLVRGYGTFPHPNALSAFLVAGVLLSIYLFQITDKIWKKSLFGAAIIINILGLTVTFSRAAFFALTISLILFYGLSYYRKQWNKYITTSLALIIIAVIGSLILFSKFILVRGTISDQAVTERGLYNQIGLNMIKDKPIFGQGIGESVLHMQQYSNITLSPWQNQPIHNYYLLSAAELGIPFALILAWIFISHIFNILNLNILKLFGNWKLEIENFQFGIFRLTVFSILLSFLILMLFDHYFYTLQQTQMLLWVILGFMVAETKTPQVGEPASSHQ